MKIACSVGTDIVDVARIRRSVRNKRFLQKVFTPAEIKYCLDKKNAAQHFAVRFAAKEAVWKALSAAAPVSGISHLEISVRRLPSGQPVAQLSKRLKKYEKNLSLSLSHIQAYAVATAIYCKA